MRQRLQESERLSTGETLRLFAQALHYVRPFRGRFGLKMLIMLGSLLPLLLIPWPIKIIIDHVIEGIPLADKLDTYPFFLRPFLAPLADAGWGTLLGWLAATQAFLIVLVGAFGTSGRERDDTDAGLAEGYDRATRTENDANFGHSFAGGLYGLMEYRFTLRLTQALNHHYRSRLFGRIQSLPLPTFDDESIGDAVYRVMYDTPAITNTAYRVLLTPVVAPAGILLTVGMLWFVVPDHPTLLWIALSFIPGALLVTYPFAGVLRRREGRGRQAGAATTSTVEEGITNILAVQSLGGEARQRGRFERDSWTSFSRYRAYLLVVLAAAVFALVPVALVVRYAFVYIADLVIEGAITRGDVTLLFTYFAQIAGYAFQLGALWILLQESAPGLHRVAFLMGLPAESDGPDSRPLPPIRHGVELDSVDFVYDDGTAALRGVSLEARIGEVTALVGPAGAGKTTLAYLIPRFLDPTSGTVRIDGVDLATASHESLRSQVAFVFQEMVLFDGSVEENIRMGNLEASEVEVRNAARVSGAEAFIRDLPEGYATQLGRSGAKLSVGQKQRLSIARALVRNAPILILDEPTSALDPDTERTLVASIREAARTRMVLVIAHRLSTVQGADQIVFLEEGRIVEQGRPDELLQRRGGAYRRFVDLQTRGAA